MILDMLRDGKVSPDQAAELLKALGPAAVPVGRPPMRKAIVGPVGGTVLVVIGFMLPWVYLQMFSGRSFGEFLSGYNVGLVGWLILAAGMLPALLACIPSLDKHVRVDLLNALIACTGGIFVISFFVRSTQGFDGWSATPRAGLWVVAAGFVLQLLVALAGR